MLVSSAWVGKMPKPKGNSAKEGLHYMNRNSEYCLRIQRAKTSIDKCSLIFLATITF